MKMNIPGKNGLIVFFVPAGIADIKRIAACNYFFIFNNGRVSAPVSIAKCHINYPYYFAACITNITDKSLFIDHAERAGI